MAGNTGSVKAFNAAMNTMQILAEELASELMPVLEQELVDDDDLQPPIDQDPADVVDCQALTKLINALQDLHIKNCPGV